MIIRITLPSWKNCDGCPFLKIHTEKSFCKWYGKPNQGGLLEIEREVYLPMEIEGDVINRFNHLRPAKCIEENKR